RACARELKDRLASVVVEDQGAGGSRSANVQQRTSRGEDSAFIISPEFTPTKGLDLKPMFSWFHADGLTAGASRRNATNRRTIGGAMNGVAAYAGANGAAPAGGDSSYHEERYTVGLDTRWRIGGLGLDPPIADP